MEKYPTPTYTHAPVCLACGENKPFQVATVCSACWEPLGGPPRRRGGLTHG